MKTRVSIDLLALTAAAALLAGCTVGPNYLRPAVDTPAEFHAPDAAADAVKGTNSFADVQWWDLYAEPQLTALIAEALTNNWDVLTAAARLREAKAQAGITRSQGFPSVSAGGDVYDVRSSEKGKTLISKTVDPQVHYGDTYLFSPSYELDLWGRVRRANEAALAGVLAAEENQRTVQQMLVEQVAATYLQLLEYDNELVIGRATYDSRTHSLDLTQARESGGVASLQDVYQAKVLVAQAESAIVKSQRYIEQTENALNLLLGRNPGKPVARGKPLPEQKVRDLVPPGLTSDLLARRPDIRAAEQALIAANANIGEAKAAFFPQVTLTGSFGYQARQLSDLFSNPTRTWQFGPSVTVPIFTAGRLANDVKLAQAKFDEALAAYKKTVQNAFREVSDALIAYQHGREFYAKQLELTQADRDSSELSNVRYLGGVTSYLEVLYSDQQLFDAELLLSQAQCSQLLSVIQLYSALGGGWSAPAAPIIH